MQETVEENRADHRLVTFGVVTHKGLRRVDDS